MLIFGHTGITLGAVVLLNNALSKSLSLCGRENKEKAYPEPSPKVPRLQNHHSSERTSQFTFITNRIDIRLLLISSLLPDIIDKPVGQFFFKESISNGRIFCHTLLFLLLITLVGFCLYRGYGKIWLLVLSFGTFIHLIEDQMWLGLKTLLWPIYGLSFEKIDLTYWAQGIVHNLLADPTTYVPEIVGLGILVWFVVRVVCNKKTNAFIRTGKAW